jgi:hypothetical protein
MARPGVAKARSRMARSRKRPVHKARSPMARSRKARSPMARSRKARPGVHPGQLQIFFFKFILYFLLEVGYDYGYISKKMIN